MGTLEQIAEQPRKMKKSLRNILLGVGVIGVLAFLSTKIGNMTSRLIEQDSLRATVRAELKGMPKARSVSPLTKVESIGEGRYKLYLGNNKTIILESGGECFKGKEGNLVSYPYCFTRGNVPIKEVEILLRDTPNNSIRYVQGPITFIRPEDSVFEVSTYEENYVAKTRGRDLSKLRDIKKGTIVRIPSKYFTQGHLQSAEQIRLREKRK